MKSRKRLVMAATMALMGVGAAPAAADTIYGVTDSDQLVSFASGNPAQVSTPIPITGLAAGDTIAGIDFRPATLKLQAVGTSGQFYTVDTVTGAATAVGAPLTMPALTGTNFDIDFNPTVDRLRIVSDADQNLRANPNTGGPNAINDGTLAYAPGDTNAGDNPNVTAVAYANSFPASNTYPAPPTTTLYDIDVDNDVLADQTPANSGTLNTIGSLGIDVSAVAGLDIATREDGSNVAFAVLRTGEEFGGRLYRINLATGAATAVAKLPQVDFVQGDSLSPDRVKDISVAPAVPTFQVLTSGAPQGLATVRADRPDQILGGVRPISGLTLGDQLVGIDTRPATGVLYGVSSGSQVYSIDPNTAVATPIGGPFTPAASGANFGVDFNPAADRVRFVSDTRQDLRLNQLDGTVAATDGTLTYAGGDANAGQTPGVTAAAYTNSIAAPVSTLLFDIDTANNRSVTQDPPNSGTLNTVGALGVDPTDVNGYEIVPRFNQQFAALQVTGETGSKLYSVNGSGAASPANGSVALIGDLGLPAGTLAQGLTMLNADTIQLGASTAAVTEGGTATLTVSRPNSNGGAASVQVTTADDTATAGSDYTAQSVTVTFGPGETTKTVALGTTQDTAVEGDETFSVALSAPTGGATIGSPSGANIVIVDDEAPPVYTIPGDNGNNNGNGARKRPGIKASVRPKRDRKKPYQFTTTGRLKLPSGVSKSAGCKGQVGIKIKRARKGRDKTVGSRRATVRSNCKFTKKRTFGSRRLKTRRGTLKFVIRFQGNNVLKPRRTVEKAKFGKPKG